MGEENKTRIELFYLPPYSQERNPDEYGNNDVKQVAGAAMTGGPTALVAGYNAGRISHTERATQARVM